MKRLFKVLNGGLLTTIQDLGRKGYQKYGLSVSGAIDYYAHRMGNVLVCNNEKAATLEVTLVGLKLKVLKPIVIAITGGNLNPFINDNPAPMWTSFVVHEGDIISFRGTTLGCRAYLAIQGGINVETVMGSKSTDILSGIGGKEGRALKKNDIVNGFSIQQNKSKITGRRRIPSKLIPEYSSNITVRVILGTQNDAFTDESLHTFFSTPYTISSNSDRMACRLEGAKIEHINQADIASEGMFNGAIQVPKNGLPILFQAGRSSIGGYTKIGGVITVDLPKVAQLKPRDTIRFEACSLDEAQSLLIEEMKMFKILNRSFNKK